MCSGLSAVAQTTSTNPGTASVTSTIRVRIPDFATVTLGENRMVSDPQPDEVTTRSPDLAALRANKKWILQTDRSSRRRDRSDTDTGSHEMTVIIHTATAE
ncbi:MAG TPA: hypothetical protein VGE15_00970 [Sphingobacteriaceae bacterium]